MNQKTKPDEENAEIRRKTESQTTNKKTEKPDYYYDDAHGYEIYNPEEDDESDE